MCCARTMIYKTLVFILTPYMYNCSTITHSYQQSFGENAVYISKEHANNKSLSDVWHNDNECGTQSSELSIVFSDLEEWLKENGIPFHEKIINISKNFIFNFQFGAYLVYKFYCPQEYDFKSSFIAFKCEQFKQTCHHDKQYIFSAGMRLSDDSFKIAPFIYFIPRLICLLLWELNPHYRLIFLGAMFIKAGVGWTIYFFTNAPNGCKDDIKSFSIYTIKQFILFLGAKYVPTYLFLFFRLLINWLANYAHNYFINCEYGECQNVYEIFIKTGLIAWIIENFESIEFFFNLLPIVSKISENFFPGFFENVIASKFPLFRFWVIDFCRKYSKFIYANFFLAFALYSYIWLQDLKLYINFNKHYDNAIGFKPWWS